MYIPTCSCAFSFVLVHLDLNEADIPQLAMSASVLLWNYNSAHMGSLQISGGIISCIVSLTK